MWPCTRPALHAGLSLQPLPLRCRGPKLTEKDLAGVSARAGVGASVLCFLGQKAMPWWKVKRASLENSSMVGIAEMAQDGRGRRLVAAQDILKGTEIFMESPVLWVAQEAGMEEVAAQLQDLTPAVQDSLLQLCQSSSLPPEELAIIEELASGNDQLFALLRVYLINSIGTPDGGSAIYLKASRAPGT